MPIRVVNPRSDERFVELARRLEVHSAEELLECLRWWYPRVALRVVVGPLGHELWFIDRDGLAEAASSSDTLPGPAVAPSSRSRRPRA